jgi:hypothetical protein
MTMKLTLVLERVKKRHQIVFDIEQGFGAWRILRVQRTHELRPHF